MLPLLLQKRGDQTNYKRWRTGSLNHRGKWVQTVSERNEAAVGFRCHCLPRNDLTIATCLGVRGTPQVANSRRLVNFIAHFTLLPIRGYAAGGLNN